LTSANTYLAQNMEEDKKHLETNVAGKSETEVEGTDLCPKIFALQLTRYQPKTQLPPPTST
jgi:hypothetical protein